MVKTKKKSGKNLRISGNQGISWEKKKLEPWGHGFHLFFFPQKKDDRIGEVLLYLCVFAVLFMVKKTEHCFGTVLVPYFTEIVWIYVDYKI